MFYGESHPDEGQVISICSTAMNQKLSLKKGQTITVKSGFITENDLDQIAYLTFSAINTNDGHYQTFMVKVKK